MTDMEQDDAFRLTAVDVRRYDFATVMRGYDRARVDQFKEQVADEMERLMRSNSSWLRLSPFLSLANSGS